MQENVPSMECILYICWVLEPMACSINCSSYSNSREQSVTYQNFVASKKTFFFANYEIHPIYIHGEVLQMQVELC
jgi:hypothetical protein